MKNHTTAVGEKRVTVYEVFVSGHVAKAWEDELMRSP
jgi:outer membrane receptor for monomeric catechols